MGDREFGPPARILSTKTCLRLDLAATFWGRISRLPFESAMTEPQQSLQIALADACSALEADWSERDQQAPEQIARLFSCWSDEPFPASFIDLTSFPAELAAAAIAALVETGVLEPCDREGAEGPLFVMPRRAEARELFEQEAKFVGDATWAAAIIERVLRDYDESDGLVFRAAQAHAIAAAATVAPQEPSFAAARLNERLARQFAREADSDTSWTQAQSYADTAVFTAKALWIAEPDDRLKRRRYREALSTAAKVSGLKGDHQNAVTYYTQALDVAYAAVADDLETLDDVRALRDLANFSSISLQEIDKLKDATVVAIRCCFLLFQINNDFPHAGAIKYLYSDSFNRLSELYEKLGQKSIALDYFKMLFLRLTSQVT